MTPTTATFYLDDITLVPVDMTVYQDALSPYWVDYSFPTGVANFASTSPVYSGTDAIAVGAQAFNGLFLHSCVPLHSDDYSAVK